MKQIPGMYKATENPFYVIESRRDLWSEMAKRIEKETNGYYFFQQCRLQLCEDFPKLYNADICKVLNFHSGSYTKTYKALKRGAQRFEEMHRSQDIDLRECRRIIRIKLENDKGDVMTMAMHWMKVKRSKCGKLKLTGELLKEVKAMRERKESELTETHGCNDISLGQHDEEKHTIECACCFGEFDFDKLAQCSDGHLVCIECLHGYTSQQIYGSVKFELLCMAEDCTATYLRSELERCLPKRTLEKWDERLQEENLRMSKLDLTRCPHCHYGGILSPMNSKWFSCLRETCQRSTCRQCGIDYNEHIGKSCNELEKKDETKMRKKYEEKMSKAIIRTCPKCQSEFFKDGGCNKMSCHCGMSMCYICRKPEIDYTHFCNHPHSPGKGCKQCKKCLLWADPKQDEQLIIRNLKDEADRKRKRLGFNEKKLIGAPLPKALKFQK